MSAREISASTAACILARHGALRSCAFIALPSPLAREHVELLQTHEHAEIQARIFWRTRFADNAQGHIEESAGSGVTEPIMVRNSKNPKQSGRIKWLSAPVDTQHIQCPCRFFIFRGKSSTDTNTSILIYREYSSKGVGCATQNVLSATLTPSSAGKQAIGVPCLPSAAIFAIFCHFVETTSILEAPFYSGWRIDRCNKSSSTLCARTLRSLNINNAVTRNGKL